MLLQSTAIKSGSLVVFQRRFLCRTDAGAIVEIHRVDRTKTQRVLENLDRLAPFVGIVLNPSQPAPGPRPIGIKPKSAIEQHSPVRWLRTKVCTAPRTAKISGSSLLGLAARSINARAMACSLKISSVQL
jgi:hypothetical protein